MKHTKLLLAGAMCVCVQTQAFRMPDMPRTIIWPSEATKPVHAVTAHTAPPTPAAAEPRAEAISQKHCKIQWTKDAFCIPEDQQHIPTVDKREERVQSTPAPTVSTSKGSSIWSNTAYQQPEKPLAPVQSDVSMTATALIAQPVTNSPIVVPSNLSFHRYKHPEDFPLPSTLVTYVRPTTSIDAVDGSNRITKSASVPVVQKHDNATSRHDHAAAVLEDIIGSEDPVEEMMEYAKASSNNNSTMKKRDNISQKQMADSAMGAIGSWDAIQTGAKDNELGPEATKEFKPLQVQKRHHHKKGKGHSSDRKLKGLEIFSNVMNVISSFAIIKRGEPVAAPAETLVTPVIQKRDHVADANFEQDDALNRILANLAALSNAGDALVERDNQKQGHSELNVSEIVDLVSGVINTIPSVASALADSNSTEKVNSTALIEAVIKTIPAITSALSHADTVEDIGNIASTLVSVVPKLVPSLISAALGRRDTNTTDKALPSVNDLAPAMSDVIAPNSSALSSIPVEDSKSSPAERSPSLLKRHKKCRGKRGHRHHRPAKCGPAPDPAKLLDGLLSSLQYETSFYLDKWLEDQQDDKNARLAAERANHLTTIDALNSTLADVSSATDNGTTQGVTGTLKAITDNLQALQREIETKAGGSGGSSSSSSSSGGGDKDVVYVPPPSASNIEADHFKKVAEEEEKKKKKQKEDNGGGELLVGLP